MRTGLFLNELSLTSEASSVVEAQGKMKCLVGLLGEAVRLRCENVLRTHANVNHLLLAPSYHLHQWRNDQNVDRDERAFFNLLTLKTPYLVDLPADKFLSPGGYEVLCGGTTGIGLTSAYICDGLSVSLLADEIWDAAEIQAEVRSLNEDAEIEACITRLKHASRKSHITEHASWLANRNAFRVRNGGDIWELRVQILPQLNFSAHLQAIFESIGDNHFCFEPILRKLRNLQEVAANWKAGPFLHEQIEGKARQDSETTMQKYGAERKFLCSDDVRRTFCWHISLPSGWRLYYEPNPQNHSIFVGYIGQHLSTVKFN